MVLLFIAAMFTTPVFAQKKRNKKKKRVKTQLTIPQVKPEIPTANLTKVTTVEGITEYQMDNGLRVLLFPDQSKATITVNITYLVGSRHEGYGETGMAHLLEHLVFKGTPNHPDIPQELTEHGARPNGTTWYDRTNYFETFTATDENLDWALDLEADRMINSFIAKKDLDSEMTVVRNEYEAGENRPSGVLLKRVMGAGYMWHNYGQSTIGARSDLENVPIDRLKAFYKKYYQPDNAVLVVAGKINEEKTLKLIKEKFGKIPRPERELIPTYTKEPTQDGERLVTLRRSGDVQAMSCMYHVPPGPHADYAAVAVIEELLTDQPSGRLYKALMEPKIASYVWGFAPGLKEGGFIYMGADVRKENDLQKAKEILVATLDGLKENPPTEEEVQRAKTRILKNWDLSYNNADRVGRRMSEYIAQGDWRLFFMFRDNVEAIETQDVVRVAKNYFKPSNRTIGLFYPTEDADRAEIPDAPDVMELVKDYKGREDVAVGEEFDPSPKNIESRTTRGEAKSGIEYALLSKETRGDAVAAQITFRYGSPKALAGKSTAASMVTDMLMRGTETMNRQEIKDRLDQLNANVRIYGGTSSVTARIETEHDNLPELIDLVADMMKNPTFDANEFDKMKEEELAYREEGLSDPQAVANNTFSRLLNPYPKGDVRYKMTLEESIEAVKNIKLEDVKDFHQTFYGASDATVAIVGDFDEAAIKGKIEEHFGDWKSPADYERIANTYQPIKAANQNLETPDKANAMFFAGTKMQIRDDHPDYAAMMLGNYMLGGGFLNSRLATRIRRTDGLSYGVGSWFNASAQDESATFGGYAIYAPENRDAVEAAFKEEIQKVRTEGFSQEEMDAAKSGWLQSRTVSRAQDGSLSGTLNRYLDIDRDLMWDESLEQKIADLTVEQINTAIAKHLNEEALIYVKAGDFAGVEEKIKP